MRAVAKNEQEEGPPPKPALRIVPFPEKVSSHPRRNDPDDTPLHSRIQSHDPIQIL
jgi:hypothetical protein